MSKTHWNRSFTLQFTWIRHLGLQILWNKSIETHSNRIFALMKHYFKIVMMFINFLRLNNDFVKFWAAAVCLKYTSWWTRHDETYVTLSKLNWADSARGHWTSVAVSSIQSTDLRRTLTSLKFFTFSHLPYTVAFKPQFTAHSSFQTAIYCTQSTSNRNIPLTVTFKPWSIA